MIEAALWMSNVRVDVDVVAPVIGAALVNGNDTVTVADAVSASTG